LFWGIGGGTGAQGRTETGSIETERGALAVPGEVQDPSQPAGASSWVKVGPWHPVELLAVTDGSTHAGSEHSQGAH
jgi:hypothetical protein